MTTLTAKMARQRNAKDRTRRAHATAIKPAGRPMAARYTARLERHYRDSERKRIEEAAK